MPTTTPDGFPYEVPGEAPGISLHGGLSGTEDILAEKVQEKVTSIDSDISELTTRLDYHEAVFDTAGSGTDQDLTGSTATLEDVTIPVPSHWSTWQAEILATMQVEPLSVGGSAAASDRRLTVLADDSSSQIGFAWQYTLEATKDDDVITAIFTNPSGSAGSGSITFRLRASLTTNDNYRVTVVSMAVTLHRLT